MRMNVIKILCLLQSQTSALAVLELLFCAVRSDSGTGLKVWLKIMLGLVVFLFFFNCRVIMCYFTTSFANCLRWLHQQRCAKPKRGNPDWWSQRNHGLLQAWRQQSGLCCGWNGSEMVLHWRCRRDLPWRLSTNSGCVYIISKQLHFTAIIWWRL